MNLSSIKYAFTHNIGVKLIALVVALFICPKAEAEKYREGAETFIDAVFFQEEIRECLDYLQSTISRFEKR